MKTTMVSKREESTTVFLETASINTLSLTNWDIIKDFVSSGVGVHLSEECSNNSLNFRPRVEDGEDWKGVVMSMDINGFHMMTNIEKDSKHFFEHVVFSTHQIMGFGIWARVDINPQ